VVCPGQHWPDVAACPPNLATQWAPLRWPDWTEQGWDRCQAWRGTGQDLEAFLWYSSPIHGWRAWLLSDHKQGDSSAKLWHVESFCPTRASIFVTSELVYMTEMQLTSMIFLFLVGSALLWPDRGPASQLWKSQGHHCQGTSLLERRDCSTDQGGKAGSDCCPWQQPAGHCEASWG